MQEGRPTGFESSPIKGKYLHKPIYEKEMLAILHALNKWHPYLMGRHLKIKKIIVVLNNSWNKSYIQNISKNELGYDFDIIYKKKEEKCCCKCIVKKER